MTTGIRNLTTSLVLLGSLGLAGMATGLPARAGQVSPPPVSALRLQVDKPIIHLGERVYVSGDHFTPGARLAISLHGPMSATIGSVYARSRVDGNGHFGVPLVIARYPDTAARQMHTVVVAVLSPASLDGVQEGAAVAVQADPMPGLDIVTGAGLLRTSLVIDGTDVPALVIRKDATHYRISYAGHLRAGRHSAYLKWSDALGGWGARSWNFRIGWPYAVEATPRLNLSAYRIRLGMALGVVGNNFTPGATITVSLGGPNLLSGAPVARATVGSDGAFHLVVRVTRYPDANARAAHMVYVGVAAGGAAVGDLPEGVAVPVQVR